MSPKFVVWERAKITFTKITGLCSYLKRVFQSDACLYRTTDSDWSKLKAYADKLNVAKLITFVPERVENIVRKGKNAGYQHFLLCPQCFQKLVGH